MCVDFELWMYIWQKNERIYERQNAENDDKYIDSP